MQKVEQNQGTCIVVLFSGTSWHALAIAKHNAQLGHLFQIQYTALKAALQTVAHMSACL